MCVELGGSDPWIGDGQLPQVCHTPLMMSDISVSRSRIFGALGHQPSLGSTVLDDLVATHGPDPGKAETCFSGEGKMMIRAWGYSWLLRSAALLILELGSP